MGRTPERAYFTEHEWRTVEAATARIIPTDFDPGAREANVVGFIDRYLSGIDNVYANPWGSGFLRLEGRQAKAWQIRIEDMRRTYRDGLEVLDEMSRTRHRRPFADLADDEQDEVLAELSPAGRVPSRFVPDKEHDLPAEGSDGGVVSPGHVQDDGLDFFGALVAHTRMGFYADPAYGGNTDRIGWQVIGFPGPASLAETTDGRYSTAQYLTPVDDYYQAAGLIR
jgi:gluconate 2-dehydrogenase gamma chain